MAGPSIADLRQREAEQARRRESLALALVPVVEGSPNTPQHTPQRTPRSTRASDLRRQAALAARALAGHSCQSTPSPAAGRITRAKTPSPAAGRITAPGEQQRQNMRWPVRGCAPAEAKTLCTPRATEGAKQGTLASYGTAKADYRDKVDEAECLAALDEWRVDSDLSSPIVYAKPPQPHLSPCDVTAVAFEACSSNPASKLSFSDASCCIDANDPATRARHLLTTEPSFKAHILCVLSAEDFGPVLRDPTVARHFCQWLHEEQASWPSEKHTLYLRSATELQPGC